MGATNFDGPVNTYGNMGYLTQGPVPDYNQDASPNLSFMGVGIPDVRFPFLKEQVQGYTGKVPALWQTAMIQIMDATPQATGAANIVAAGATLANGTAVTLVNSKTTAVATVPMVPMGASAPVTVDALDFGFTTANCTSGNTTVVVTDSTMFEVGEPLVIGGVGNAGGTAALLTNVVSITDATHVVLAAAPLATLSTAPVGTGNVWGPSEIGFPTPVGALAYVGQGPGLFLDPRQAVTRAVVATASASVTGGILVSGYDIYGIPMSETISFAAGTSATGKKAFKYIASVVPQFSNAATFSLGTQAVYGLHLRANNYANVDVYNAGVLATATTGFTAGTTAASGDVRGTYAAAAGTNLVIFQKVSPAQMLNSDAINSTALYGPTQT